jgi:hypothetical protein
MLEKIGIWEVSDDFFCCNSLICICIHLGLALDYREVWIMVIHSIIVLVAFLSCIVGPIIFAIQAYGLHEDEKERSSHHFLKG